MAERRGGSVSLGSILGYSDIAKQMGIDVKSVRIYASRDEDFPEPITPREWRSPGFAKKDVDRYLARRRARSVGKSGRPPVSGDVERVQLGPEVGVRIRELLAEKREAASIHAVKEIAPLLDLSVASVGFRMRGTARWRQTELELVAKALGADVDEITGAGGAVTDGE